MRIRFLAIVWLACTLVTLMSHANTQKKTTQRVFLIGNSLTMDALPALLDGDVEWHIDCGKNLPYIYDHPRDPCVKSSTPWPEALKTVQYDQLCVQPHFGSTLQQDVRIITEWLKLQPGADLVLHTGWERSKDFETTFHQDGAATKMTHTPQYFAALRTKIKEAFPDRTIRCTSVIEVLDSIYHDIEQGRGPIKSFDALYRDEIHMTHQEGRYLAHNLVRVALGQPVSDQGFQIEDEPRKYLDRKIDEFLKTNHSTERK